MGDCLHYYLYVVYVCLYCNTVSEWGDVSNCCLSVLALLVLNLVCLSSTKWSSSHQNVACSRHDMAEKLPIWG